MAEMISVSGPPGSGKSHMLRSAAEVGKVAIALTDPKEIGFYKQKVDEKQIKVFVDLNWRPHFGKYNADGYNKLMDWTAAQADSDAEFVLFDHGTNVALLAKHEALKMSQTDDYQDLSHGRGYMSHDNLMRQWLQELQRLWIKGRWVGVSWHVSMKEAIGAGQPEKREDMSGKKEWHFEERLLPVLDTKLRQHIAGEFSGWFYTYFTGHGAGKTHLISGLPTQASLAKHRLAFKEHVEKNGKKIPVNVGAIPNDFKSLLEVLQT